MCHCFCWEWKSLFGIALIRSGEDWGYHGVEMPAVGASSPLACSAWELPSSSSFSNNLLHHQLLLLLPHHLLLLLLAAHGICCLLPCSTFLAPHWLPVAQNLQKKYYQRWREHRAKNALNTDDTVYTVYGESSCQGGSEYVYQRWVEGVLGWVTGCRSWPLFQKKK